MARPGLMSKEKEHVLARAEVRPPTKATPILLPPFGRRFLSLASALGIALSLATSAHATVPFVSPEIEVDAPASLVKGSLPPSIATDGSTFFVAWSHAGLSPGPPAVLLTRVGLDGHLVGPGPLTVAVSRCVLERPVIARDGDAYLIVWQDCYALNPYYTAGIAFARVSADGALIDAEPTFLAGGIARPYDPSVVGTGDGWLVAWTDQRAEDSVDIYTARIDHDGEVLDPEGVRITENKSFKQNVALSFDGTQSLIVWQEDVWESSATDLRAARVAGSGELLDPQPIVVSDAPFAQRTPAVSHDGTNWTVVWQDCRTQGEDECDPSQIYGTRITPLGDVLDPEGIAVTELDDIHAEPAIAWDGDGYAVAWRVGFMPSQIAYKMLSSDGDPYPFEAPVSSGMTNYAPWTECAAGRCLTAWAGELGLLGFRTREMKRLDAFPLPISVTANDQLDPSVASSGEDFLVTWLDNRSGVLTSDLFATRLSADGDVLDATSIDVRVDASVKWWPSASFNGSSYVIAWHDHDWDAPDPFSAKAVRVSSGGVRLDAPPLVLSDLIVSAPVSASGSGESLVLWGQHPAASTMEIGGARVADASFSPVPTTSTTDSRWITNLAVAASSTHYLQAWRYQHDEAPSPGEEVYASLRGMDGAPVGAPETVVSAGLEGTPTIVSAASDGTGFLVVWHAFVDEPPERVKWAIHAAIVRAENGLLEVEPFTIVPLGGCSTFSRVVFDGDRYVVVWGACGVSGEGLRAAFLDPSGERLEPSELVVSTDPIRDAAHSVAANDGGDVLVAYDRFRFEPEFFAYRINARVVAYDGIGLGRACTESEKCASGHCVDGVCCESGCGEGAPDDCVACSVAAGASVDGVCAPVEDGTFCPAGRCEAGVCTASSEAGPLADATDATDASTATCDLVDAGGGCSCASVGGKRANPVWLALLLTPAWWYRRRASA